MHTQNTKQKFIYSVLDYICKMKPGLNFFAWGPKRPLQHQWLHMSNSSRTLSQSDHMWPVFLAKLPTERITFLINNIFETYLPLRWCLITLEKALFCTELLQILRLLFSEDVLIFFIHTSIIGKTFLIRNNPIQSEVKMLQCQHDKGAVAVLISS